MATSHTRDLELPYPYQVVLDAIVRSGPEVRLKVSTVDPARGMVFATRPMTMWSGGLNVTFQLGQQAPHLPTQVRVHSALMFGLVDWGINRRYVDRLVGAVTGWLETHAAATRIA